MIEYGYIPLKDNTHSHPYNTSCGYCNHDEFSGYSFGEDSSAVINTDMMWFTVEDTVKPFKYNYLLNLMTAPDMNAYLSFIIVNDDDIFNLPLHLQKLIMEAKEEIALLSDKEKPAQKKLEKLKRFIWERSYGDFSILMNTLTELVSNEGELEELLQL